MIKIDNLDVSLGSKQILKNISLNFEQGKFTTIIGPNGCGKSTLVKSILGVNKYLGKIKVDKIDRNKYNRKDFSKKVAVLMQVRNIPMGMTVKELVTQGRHPYRKAFSYLTKEDHEMISWAMEITDVLSIKDNFLHVLSGGERQRVWLAMALCQDPDILILDEPTNHLDLKYQYELLNIVSKLNKENGVTIICVLHEVSIAAKYSDTIVILKDGEVVMQDTPKKCFTKEIIQQVYEINTKISFKDNNFMMCVV